MPDPASNGIWDVILTETAYHVAHQCLQDGNLPPVKPIGNIGYEAEPRYSLAASVLARFTLARKSEDKISVIIIDLR